MKKGENERGREEGKEKGRARRMSWDTRSKEKMSYIIQMFCLRQTKHQAFGKHLEDTMLLSLRRQLLTVLSPLSLCVCVYPFQAFLWSNYKGLFSGWVTSHWPQKLIFPATKYTAPADEVIITERACSAEVTPSGDKGAGGGAPVERAQPLFPSVSVCLLILVLLEPNDENRSPFVLPSDPCL